jgi:S-adenosylmethionine hydrolase
MPSNWVTFCSDYGLDDVAVGVCKGVMARRCDQVQIIDVCHHIPPQEVEQGATVFATALPFLPAPAIHLVLVDPLTPQPVRPVVVQTADGSAMVGPDNGVLSLGWKIVGGVQAAYELADDRYFLDTPSRTFRGRDVFAPVVAHLVDGVAPESFGPPVDPDELTTLRLRAPVLDDDHVHAEVRTVDHFGNVALNCTRTDLEAAGIALGDPVELRCGGRTMLVPFTMTYGEVSYGRTVLCENAFRRVSVAINYGHAARQLRLSPGDAVVVSRHHRTAAAGPPAAQPGTA